MAISPAPPPPGTQAWPMDQVPDPEVPERPTRRRFAAAYKAAILDELDRAIEPGGALQQPRHRLRVACGRSGVSKPWAGRGVGCVRGSDATSTGPLPHTCV